VLRCARNDNVLYITATTNMSENQVRLQNLRDCTVQIRCPSDNAIVGTGLAVSMDGKIVTCAHVVETALGVHPRQGNGVEIGVYFPQVRSNERKDRRAKIAGCFPQYDDDVVLLQLLDGPAPLAPEQIAVLGKAEESCDHPFRSYGYRRLDKYLAGWADGKIHGCVEAPEGFNVQAEPVQLASSQINSGMSGAAVLDVERNLIVGIVAETWFPDLSTKDRDTAWAVNARVLSFAPLGLPLQDEPLPKRAAPQPKTDIAAARQAVAPEVGIVWNNAPPPLPEWVGRDDLLHALTADWQSQTCRITGLIGFGGEGKSSLARQWIEQLLECQSAALAAKAPLSHSFGVFWWGFYTKPNVEEFFEAALGYLSGGKIDPRKLPSANVKAQVIGSMLGAGRYLFVLDGLEILQHQEGDQYGLLKSNDLREFLSYFADPQQQSFCLITSRAPVLDLMVYTTYTHRDVTRLSANDGRDLLHKIGVKGDDKSLNQIVADWDGHALTLSLLATYLVEHYHGDAAKIGVIPPPTADEERYERVHRILRRYDEHLTEAERAFMTLFSAFRTPVKESAFDKVFQTCEVFKTSQVWDIAAMLQRLIAYRILHYDPRALHYTTHPLIRSHYYKQLTAGDRAQAQDVHKTIKDYYLQLAGETPQFPTLDDLRPLIEAVHHACRAGAYDEAEQIRWERIYQQDRRVLFHQLAAYETNLTIMQEFFPDGDISQEPQVSKPSDKSWILNTVGLCLMSLGDLSYAISFYERSNQIKLNVTKDWHNASVGYRNLAELHAYLGALVASADEANAAFVLAQRTENEWDERDSLCREAMTAHLRGDLETAGVAFWQAEKLEQEIDVNKRYLYSLRGIQHADHLRRTDEADYARLITETNLEICERNHWAEIISQCHRVLGDLNADDEQYDRAREHYDAALKLAQGTSYRPALIEALLARGRWQARHVRAAAAAFSDLNEALEYAVSGGYRIYEADIRIALAWAHLSPGPSPASGQGEEAARAEATRALQMSTEMGYYWGQVDAEEVLQALHSS
jgi:tetratricopeptide (TPR) repeat protein